MKEKKKVQQRVLLCGSNLEFLRLESLAVFETNISHQIDKVCLFLWKHAWVAVSKRLPSHYVK